MLDANFVRENRELVEQKLRSRGLNIDLSEFFTIDEQRRAAIREAEELKRVSNIVSKEIGEAVRRGEDVSARKEEMRVQKDRVREQDDLIRNAQEKLENILLNVPNLPNGSVPIGATAADNVVVREHQGSVRVDFPAKTHNIIGTQLGILDFERAAKITGSRFVLDKGAGALLERALINFMIDVHTANGYVEVLPPFIVNADSLRGTGNLPKFEEDLFRLADTNYYLIPTAEVPVTNIYRDEVLNEEDLPIRFVAYSPCFRREAGTYGQETRGLIRVHQFNKVEIVHFSKPEDSYKQHEQLTNDAEEILRRLDLTYRVLLLCTGDLGFSSAKTYDLEVWMPGQNAFVEISSCSNFEDYQARRTNIRMKKTGAKGTRLVHTLNGSGLAIGRTVAAILENYQQKDGSVRVPEVLVQYMKGMRTIE
ncbi:MAG TPA: serine--tRNA ligase [Acidobacteriota bacterium]|nr:serine--tRNA ligase [Acidobacteriota bacterium]